MSGASGDTAPHDAGTSPAWATMFRMVVLPPASRPAAGSASRGEGRRPDARPTAFAPYASPLTRPCAEPRRPAEPSGVWRPGAAAAPGSPLARVVADSRDVEEWLAARAAGVTASDAAKLATPNSVRGVVRDKLAGGQFTGNAYTDFGREREPRIAAWMRERHGIPPSTSLFHAEASRRHLATPDGLHCEEDGAVLLAEIKTTNKEWSRIPRAYLRQVYWQQYVLGASRTLFVWERHEDFVVRDPEPRCTWIERDEAEIARLVGLAKLVLAELDRHRDAIECSLEAHAAGIDGRG